MNTDSNAELVKKLEILTEVDLDCLIREMTEVYEVSNDGFHLHSLGHFTDPKLVEGFKEAERKKSNWDIYTRNAYVLVVNGHCFALDVQHPVIMIDETAERAKQTAAATGKLKPHEVELIKKS